MLKKFTIGCVALLAPVAALSIVTFNTAAASAAILVTGLVNGSNPVPIPGNQAWPGQLGDDFVTTAPLAINSIAVFDDNGDGTSVPLTWQLFEVSTGLLVSQFVVPPSGPRVPGSTVVSNYIFQPILPLLLAANTAYSAVAYGFDNANKNFNTNLGPSNADVLFSNLGLNGAGGRYSAGPSVLLPSVDAGNSVSGNPYNFGAASFEYSVVPEPTGMIIWSLLGLTISGAGWWRRRKVSA